MKNVSILDCTLRDGGYINQWNFGAETIRGIINKLTDAGVEIIECGFLRNVDYQKDVALFSNVAQIQPFIAPKKSGVLYVAMIAFGDIDVDDISPYDGTSIDGIRLTFHKEDWPGAKEAAKKLMQKGYKVFIQPVGTTSYSDQELLTLIHEVNLLQPYAFYLVDTLGIMYRHDLLRLFYLIEHNLDSEISIGFHSHNNLQMSFSNAQELIRLNSKHHRIIDASVYGMGRGVGNLSTELLSEYINANVETRYRIIPLLSIADEHLFSIYAEYTWGYALPYYLSATEKCHPNYATYLLGKDTLTMEEICKILSLLPVDKRDIYHPELVEALYVKFQDYWVNDNKALQYIQSIVEGKDVLILAPGPTLKTEWHRIQSYIEERNPIVISTNFIPEAFEVNAVFVSNKKRLVHILEHTEKNRSIIATSNLINELESKAIFVNYGTFIGEGGAADNVGAMLIRLLTHCKVKFVALAGFDGFDVDAARNYCVGDLRRYADKAVLEQKNRDIEKQLNLALAKVSHKIITPTRYKIND